MKWLAMIFLLLFVACQAFAQMVVSARSGIIQYTEGEAWLGGQSLKLSPGNQAQMENGQSIRTDEGYVELLLSPYVYVRLGKNGLLQMQQTQLDDTRLRLERGSVIVEVVQKMGRPARFQFLDDIIEIQKSGLYRIDAGSRELRVYGGVVLVTSAKGKKTVKSGRSMILDGEYRQTRFDADAADALHKWAARRSFDLFIGSPISRKQMHWKPISQGWLTNFDYHMSFYSELFFADWLRNQQSETRDSAMEGLRISRQAEQNRPAIYVPPPPAAQRSDNDPPK